MKYIFTLLLALGTLFCSAQQAVITKPNPVKHSDVKQDTVKALFQIIHQQRGQEPTLNLVRGFVVVFSVKDSTGYDHEYIYLDYNKMLIPEKTIWLSKPYKW